MTASAGRVPSATFGGASVMSSRIFDAPWRNGMFAASASASRLLSGGSPPPSAFSVPTLSRKIAASLVNTSSFCPTLNLMTSTFSPGIVMSWNVTNPRRKSSWFFESVSANLPMPFFRSSMAHCILFVTSRTKTTSTGATGGACTASFVPAVSFSFSGGASAVAITFRFALPTAASAAAVNVTSTSPGLTTFVANVMPAGSGSTDTVTGPS